MAQTEKQHQVWQRARGHRCLLDDAGHRKVLPNLHPLPRQRVRRGGAPAVSGQQGAWCAAVKHGRQVSLLGRPWCLPLCLVGGFSARRSAKAQPLRAMAAGNSCFTSLTDFVKQVITSSYRRHKGWMCHRAAQSQAAALLRTSGVVFTLTPLPLTRTMPTRQRPTLPPSNRASAPRCAAPPS